MWSLKDKKGHPAETEPGDKLGKKPDGSAYNPYPVSYPKAADEQVERSICGDYENAKTAHQDGLDEKK